MPRGVQLSQRQSHEQPGRCVRQMVLALVAFVQKAEVLFSTRQVKVKCPPHPVVVRVFDSPFVHRVGHRRESSRKRVGLRAAIPSTLWGFFVRLVVFPAMRCSVTTHGHREAISGGRGRAHHGPLSNGCFASH